VGWRDERGGVGEEWGTTFNIVSGFFFVRKRQGKEKN